MWTPWASLGIGFCTPRMMHLTSSFLLLQFLFRFSQGQGPGLESNQHFNISENLLANTEVGVIHSQSPYIYSFSDNSNAQNYFELEPTTGRITTKIVIDREILNLPENQFNILIIAKNPSNENYPVEITIEILDENDNDPTFPTQNVQISFRENSNKGSNFYIKTATDIDMGLNSLVNQYAIVAGDGPFQLVFNPDLYGDVLIVQTTGKLDRETRSQYALVIQAKDSGSPRRSGSTTINIRIEDENDNPPIFDPSSYEAKVNETDDIGTFVVQTIASDRDIGVNQDITYRFTDQNAETAQFQIEENTGRIITSVRPLVCPTGRCLLRVEARDSGVPWYSGRAFVYVTIVDTNNHDPTIVFKHVPDETKDYSSVNEDAKNGDIVAGIITSDADDGKNGQTAARIISGNELSHFRFEMFDSQNYLIRVNGDGVLDRERYHTYNLTVEARDSGNPPRISTKDLVIFVNDINDHAPEFSQKAVSLYISETTRVGSFIASMLATDLDSGINAMLTYKIESGNIPAWFHIDTDTGLITTVVDLQYHIANSFVMNISVHDGALKPFWDYASLTVRIWDENNFAPKFNQTVYNVSRDENLVSVSPVVLAAAVDRDSGDNGTLVYEFLPEVELLYPGTFHLDTATGDVTTKKSLDREEIANYVIKVIAKDVGPAPLTSTATIYLKVNDINDNSPSFYPKNYFVKVMEGQDQGAEVIQVSATDLDEGINAVVTYSFSSPDFGKFSIDTSSGLITTKGVLQRDQRSSYTLTVLANDQFSSQMDTATVEVSVISPTDTQPFFTQEEYVFDKITEDPSTGPAIHVGNVVGQVTARADQSGTSIVYTIVQGDPDQVFSINTANGKILRAKPIDRERYPSFTLKIVATVGDKFAETIAQIPVKDVNDNPPQFTYPSLNVDLIENWPVGHHITVVSAEDIDETGPNSRVSYSLQRDHSGMFGIESDTGLLYLNKPVEVLGTDTVTLTVIAMDAGSPPFTASQELHITVVDVNDHTPQFPHTTYELSLIESHPVNSRFFNVEAQDDDTGENGALTYNITRGNEDKKFGIFPDGHLFIAKTLDRETKDFYKLSIRAWDHGQPSRSSECNITIHITDYNDNKPIFLNATYAFSVVENHVAGGYVGQVFATDSDMGRNADLAYSLTERRTDFKIDPQTGEITSLVSFDREQLDQSDFMVVFDVMVRDNGLTQLSDVATVRVKILDVNDNSPRFLQPIYKVSMFENAPTYANVTVVKATDLDSGINSIVTYDITSGNDDENFVIDQTTGQVTLNKLLDRETVDYYELVILATDSGVDIRHNASCLVQVTVKDINDNFPLFAQSQMDTSVREDEKPGQEVAYFPASDTDQGVNAEITYTMSGADHDGTFGIDRHTGKIYLLRNLDYETKRSYRLNVTATDNGVPPLPYYIRFSISIEDVNDNKPVFQNEPITCHSTEHSSGAVCGVRAEDDDSGKNGEVQYTIVNQDPQGDHFKIVKNTGQIYIDKEIDRESADMYTLIVAASDQAEDESMRLTTETTVTIAINDINDNDPVITSFKAIAVPRFTPVNEYITSVTARDLDSGDNGRFALQLLQDDGNHFSLDSNSGRVVLIKTLPDTPLKYIVNLQATDYGKPSQQTSQFQVTIFVSDNTGGPVFQGAPYSGSVAENLKSHVILTVRAVSQQSSNVEYYVTKISNSKTGELAGRYFKIDKDTGVLEPEAALDREEVGGEFDVEIYAIDTDGNRPRTSVTVAKVTLLDVNDTPPKFSKSFYEVDIDENVRNNFPIINLPVYDGDELGGLSFTIVDLPTDVNLKINIDGSIVATGPLDRETTPQYTLKVTATDGQQSSYCLVRINLLDVNDNAPEFTASFYSFDVDEDTSIGTTVGSVRAYDPDQGPNGEVMYSMTSGWGNDIFDLDPHKGTFTLRRVMDFEENELYTLLISANDSGAEPRTSSVLVYFNVKDTNDNTPLFEHATYDAAVYENVTVGASVMQVVAHDVDSGENGEVLYTITGGDMAGQFRIDAGDGIIYTTSTLDRETTALYNLVVMATDRASKPDDRRSATAEVQVTVEDVNDYIPEFLSPPVIHVLENTAMTTAVHDLSVRDLDEGVNSQIQYSIQSKSGGTPFTLGASDGKLRVNTDLDRELIQNYTLVVTAEDRGTPSLTATQTLMVVIDDENDHYPVFTPEYYDANVTEDVTIGTTLLQVAATDTDIGLNGIVKYYIISGDDNHDFILDQSSGMLRVQKALDYERVVSYELIVQAEDSGDSPNFSTATVSIVLSDVNDNEPIFLDSPFVGYVRENMDKPVFVLQATANDSDSAPFNHLQYEIRDGDRSLFNMSSSTGEIMALQTLDREQQSLYVLTIVATDSANGRGLTGSGTVSIYVEDVNDNPPVFDHTWAYVAHVEENASDDTEVIVVKATDLDEGANSQIIYSLTDSIDDKFMIFPDTGRIATRAPLDREKVSRYTLEVVAMDTSLLPLSATTIVYVHVDDMNDNRPDFEEQSYTRLLRLPASAGTFVLGVTATDKDSENNRVLVYSLSQPDGNYFNIDPDTGVITVKQTLTSSREYEFKVTATDKGNPALSSEVHVAVSSTTVAGNNPPTFNTLPTGLSVMENIQPNYTVTMVTAQASNGAAVSYDIVGGNIGEMFAIASNTGRIYVRGRVDYEVMTEYRLWVKATQGGNSPATSYAEVVIAVTDENDNAPVFTQLLYDVAIAENQRFGTSVVTVTAHDADSGNNGNIRYSLSGPDASKFKISNAGSTPGKIVTYTNLDREDVDMYSLTVVATDQGSIPLSYTASVRITILDENDESPLFTRQFRVEIPENSEIGSFVLRVTSSDKDIGSNAIATYSLTDDADGTFRIEPNSGNITLLRHLDAEVEDSYRLRVSATDGAHDVQGNVQVDVTDVNDNSPQILQPYSFNFLEMLPPGSPVGMLQATDADILSPNNNVYFSLKLASSYFELNSDSGEITSLEELTFDPAYSLDALPNRHELLVIAKDLGTPVRSSERLIYVNVMDSNDHAPVFEQDSYRSAVPESTATGNSVITVHARDELDYGVNADIEYFVSGGNGSNLFTIDRVSGIVSVKNSLTGMRNREYQIIVKAEDLGTLPMSATVPVNLVVTDQNLYAPYFTDPSSPQTSVKEDIDTGSDITTFQARDNDFGLNAAIEYRIMAGNQDGMFSVDIDTGVLSLAGTLDYERNPEYNLVISARDKALHHRENTTSYRIRLLDVNDNDPLFAQATDSVWVKENSQRGTSVYQAVAVDADTGDNAIIRYAFVGASQNQNKFQIDSTRGLVTTKGDLDYEMEVKYTLTIMALNPSSTRKSTMVLTINIEGMNEDVPRFTQDAYFFTISESAETRTSVGTVYAEDIDHGQDGIVYYFLVGDSNAKGFKVDPRTGDILVSGKPDYESSPRITLQVLAKNWGSIKGNDTDTCTVHITVEDANDPPAFSQDFYQGYLLENTTRADVSIVTVTATDSDYDAADKTFSYVILSGNTENMFKIHSSSGLVTTTGNGNLDREMVSMYNITVGAVDTGSPPETGSATVQVIIQDINDSGPFFINFTATITEEQVPPALVTTLTQFTNDPDAPGNRGPYRYDYVSGNHAVYELFSIEASGKVMTKKVIDREVTSEFVVPVLVSDAGQPTMSSTLSFKIQVLDINDSEPRPRFATVFLSLYDGSLPGTAMADVRPLDDDVTGTYRCQLEGSNPTIFRIIQNSCDLMIIGNPAEESYMIHVQGTDGSSKQVLYDVDVKVSRFDNDTLEHSTILHIADVTPRHFMENIYTSFLSAVQQTFQTQDLVQIIGLTQLDTGDLLVHIAVTSVVDDEYYSQSVLRQKLSSIKTSIESEAGIFIVSVAYSACGMNQCRNGGQCASQVAVQSSNHLADSAYRIFSSPDLELSTYCVCPPEYTGPDCGEQAMPCGDIYCQHGGVCNNQVCVCPAEWTGPSCQRDVNECKQDYCKNGASCENTAGGYTCHCPDGYFGKTCQEGENFCQSSPCVHGTCVNMVNVFQCLCDYGYHGNKCQHSSLGFHEASYIEYSTLDMLANIDVTFATSKSNSLLMYNPSSRSDSKFVALEIMEGMARLSIATGNSKVTRIMVSKQVNTGTWMRVKIVRNVETIRMWVEDCPEDGGACTECQIGAASSPCYNETQISSQLSLGLGSHPLLIGGVRDITTIINRTGQVSTHDFVGCMRTFTINSEDKLSQSSVRQAHVTDTCPRTSSEDVCSGHVCDNGGMCVRKWTGAVCQCTPQYMGDHCQTALKPIGFGPDTLINMTMKESSRRDIMLNAANSRRRRATTTSSVLVRFRTTAGNGVLMFASTGPSAYSILSVFDGQLKFTMAQFGGTKSIVITDPGVADGSWHNATVTVSAGEVLLSLDTETKRSLRTDTFLFSSPDVNKFTLGGTPSTITIDNQNLKDFTGCISIFELDGQQLPMIGETDKYVITATEGVDNGCASLCANNACGDRGCSVEGEAVVCAVATDAAALSIGIIIMIVFFVILLIVIVIVFIVFRYRRQQCIKGKQSAAGINKNPNNSGHSNPDSGYGENNIDELIIRNHIAQELAGSNYHRQNGHLVKPDIIKSDLARPAMPLEIEDGTVIIDNASDMTHFRDLNGEMPEHYDLENASSIAPSDIDIVDHYRHFHDGGRQRRKPKTHSDHSHNSKHSSRQFNHSNHGSHHSQPMRDSPKLSSVPFMNDLARNSPNSRHSPAVNQLSRNSPNVRQSPLTHVNMHGHHHMPITELSGGGSRTTSERSLASHRSKTSNSTPHKPKRQMLPNGHPANNKLLNHNYENSKFLTKDEVDRLNARPRESPASLMEAFSTSSENNTRNMKKPYEKYQDTSVLLEPPESSSDDSANDSFTCSEFESDMEGKPRNDFNPNNRIFSNIKEETETESGAYHNKNFRTDGLDSGGNSFSSNERSSDDNQAHAKAMKNANAFNWDDLLNWGPKFEKLVGVFTDIALLPDADSVDFVEVDSKSTEREEYV